VSFVQQYGKEIVSLIVPFITWLLNVPLRARPKIIWGSPHEFTFIVNEPAKDTAGKVISERQIARTKSFRIINNGRASAPKIELVFNWKPQCINIWPLRKFEEDLLEDKRYVLTFDSLAPKEEIGIEVLTVNAELPNLMTARCSDCIPREIPIRWVRAVPQWRINAAVLAMFVGMGTAVFWILTLVQYLVLRTPLVG
jgi:hypothetical protein